MLVQGKIPAHTECPFRDQCKYAAEGQCKHQGEAHTVPFSCGTARLFFIMRK